MATASPEASVQRPSSSEQRASMPLAMNVPNGNGSSMRTRPCTCHRRRWARVSLSVLAPACNGPLVVHMRTLAHPHVGYERSAAREDERAATADGEVPATIAATGVEHTDHQTHCSDGARWDGGS